MAYNGMDAVVEWLNMSEGCTMACLGRPGCFPLDYQGWRVHPRSGAVPGAPEVRSVLSHSGKPGSSEGESDCRRGLTIPDGTGWLFPGIHDKKNKKYKQNARTIERRIKACTKAPAARIAAQQKEKRVGLIFQKGKPPARKSFNIIFTKIMTNHF